MTNKQSLPVICLFFILVLVVLIYLPGLEGGFLFDDLSNLQEMNRYGDMHHWSNAQKFVMNGIAGPTGRPISLLTFIPQADAWFAGNATPFKVVNLIIHLTCGVLLYWVTYLLLKAYGENEDKKIKWIALLTVSFWLLHPFMLSTTLYVIQRMAQLPLLFSLLAFIGYFKGRATIKTKPLFAYTIMTLSIGLGTILATFSKENGALLPLLVLVLEFCNPLKENKPIWQWRAICLWLPSITIVIMLIRYVDLSADPWPNRNFNQAERLLTECRIVVDYLVQLFIPRIEGYGFFQDGFLVSKDWFTPLTTIFSFTFLSVLFLTALFLRKKYPFFSLAILFFFAAHLIESTFIGLELYFEHRNYIAAIFIFLPVAIGLYALSEQIKPSVVIFISILILGFLSILTWQRAHLWSDENKLMLYWAQNSPDSPRAQSVIAVFMAKSGNYNEANNVLERALERRPESGLLSLQLLTQKMEQGSVTHLDFDKVKQNIKLQRADTQAAIAIRDLVFFALEHPKIIEEYGDELLSLLNEMLKNQSYLNIRDFQGYALFLQGRILIVQNKPDLAFQKFIQSIKMLADVDQGITMSVIMGNANYLKQALELLDETEIVYRKQSVDTLKKSREYYESTIHQTRMEMQKDLQAELSKAIVHEN